MLPDIEQELFYRIGLTFVKDVGSVTARKLLQHYDSATDIFRAGLKELKATSGLGEVRSKAFRDAGVFERAEQEMEFITKNDVKILWYKDDAYPTRLKDCADAPVLLYTKGNIDTEAERVVAIIGTRKYTDYGQRVCENLVSDLKQEGVLVVSGLAHGIDTIAHKAAVENRLPTIGVLGHGLDKIYPVANKKLANEMMESGGLLSEYPSGSIADKRHFPMRNRIVAGLSDVTVVIESDIKGGALITARLADSYNRDVAAFPGRVYDSKSSGCNELIRTNIAAMITSAQDLLELMNWDEVGKAKPKQKALFLNLSPDEQAVYDKLKDRDNVHADELLHECKLSNSLLAATLLQMELQGIVKALPGKFYRLD